MSDIQTLRTVLAECPTIAVVGLSPQWHRPSFFAAKYMQSHGYRIVPVNPVVARESGEILGERCFASVTEAAAALAAQLTRLLHEPGLRDALVARGQAQAARFRPRHHKLDWSAHVIAQKRAAGRWAANGSQKNRVWGCDGK